jgi:hypothetical protein
MRAFTKRLGAPVIVAALVAVLGTPLPSDALLYAGTAEGVGSVWFGSLTDVGGYLHATSIESAGIAGIGSSPDRDRREEGCADIWNVSADRAEHGCGSLELTFDPAFTTATVTGSFPSEIRSLSNPDALLGTSRITVDVSVAGVGDPMLDQDPIAWGTDIDPAGPYASLFAGSGAYLYRVAAATGSLSGKVATATGDGAPCWMWRAVGAAAGAIVYSDAKAPRKPTNPWVATRVPASSLTPSDRTVLSRCPRPARRGRQEGETRNDLHRSHRCRALVGFGPTQRAPMNDAFSAATVWPRCPSTSPATSPTRRSS